MPSAQLSDQKQKFSEPHNQTIRNFVILEAVGFNYFVFQLFKAEFKARSLSLNPMTSNQSKDV